MNKIIEWVRFLLSLDYAEATVKREDIVWDGVGYMEPNSEYRRRNATSKKE